MHSVQLSRKPEHHQAVLREFENGDLEELFKLFKDHHAGGKKVKVA